MIDNYWHQNGEDYYIQETIAAVTLTTMTMMIVNTLQNGDNEGDNEGDNNNNNNNNNLLLEQ